MEEEDEEEEDEREEEEDEREEEDTMPPASSWVCPSFSFPDTLIDNSPSQIERHRIIIERTN